AGTSPAPTEIVMKRRQITLADGRYLIFYTFEDEAEAAVSSLEVKSEGTEPKPNPVAEEERRV
ncbi:MAG: hypothetical protein WBP93_10205, partial [Pyrinomonadaceae bacterium]